MRSLKFHLLLILALFLFKNSFGQSYTISPNSIRLDELGKNSTYFFDSTYALTINDILKIPDSKFKRNNTNIINFGEVKARAWIKINLDNRSSEHLYLITQFSNLHYYECFAIQKNGSILKSNYGGTSQPFSLRRVRTSIPVFALGDSAISVYLTAKSLNSLVIPIQIGSFEAIINRIHREDLICGIIFGIMFVMAFFNLFFFYKVGERMYLYYSLYVFFSCCVLMEFTGYLYEFIWRLFGIETGDYYFVTIFATIFGALFSMNFLKTKQKTPKAHYILMTLIVFAICFNPIIFKDLSRTFHRNILLSSTFVSIYGIGWYIYLTGYKPARFFVTAWTIYLTGLVCGALAEGGILSFDHWWTYYGYQLGACAEAILLSLALPDRMIYYQLLSEEAEIYRQRLSRDLHDDMGATLTSISHLGNTALKTIELKPDEPQRLKPILEQIIYAGKQATESMRGILWALSPENEETEAYFNKLVTHFGDMLRAGMLQGEFKIDENIKALKLSAYQRRSLFMFLKESLQNILKHAKCTRADIKFNYSNYVLRIEVSDDGNGFDIDQKFDGYGLKTMKYRAEELNGTLNISSSNDEGTKLILQIPIKKSIYSTSNTSPFK